MGWGYDLLLPLIIAFGIPAILIFIRNSVRQKRAGVAREIKEGFGFADDATPSFEFVEAKYAADPKDRAWPRLLIGSIPFCLVAMLGLEIIFAKAGPEGAKLGRWIAASALLGTDSTKAGEVTALLGFVFAGGILFSLGYLMRAVMNFELGPLSFLRATTHMLMAVVTVIVLWRAAPAGPDWIPSGTLWFLAAFLFGFFPDLGLRYAISRATWLPLKSERTELLERARGTPLEVIDGIDAWTRFRLDEMMIMDVQNLATANPIMLYVETPFGLYECIDWIAQAQLCIIVGPHAFLALRQHNIRTIFDLERATVREGATANLRSMIADILERSARDEAAAAAAAKKPAPRTASDEPAPVSAAKPPVALDDEDRRHLFETMLDDLHVHRLRQIWERVAAKLGTPYRRLSPLPGPAADSPPGVVPALGAPPSPGVVSDPGAGQKEPAAVAAQ
ncbi:hypothetical protein [Ancylobacter sp. FA202]|uniref:hypothetical protein n=1 Tax=Ancylobacter sp. FA202 TaxID=1111106 RepID=UPI00037C25FA|nr:hypothetical protein [Ancylobacter sp. FA202]